MIPAWLSAAIVIPATVALGVTLGLVVRDWRIEHAQDDIEDET